MTAIKPCPESLLKSYCPRHKREGRSKVGFRCICAELEVAWILGQHSTRRTERSPMFNPLKWIVCYLFDICPICEQGDIRFEPQPHRCPEGFAAKKKEAA